MKSRSQQAQSGFTRELQAASSLFRLPLEVRRQIYLELLLNRVFHVQPKHHFSLSQDVFDFGTKSQYQDIVLTNGSAASHAKWPVETARQQMTWSTLFTLHDCASTEPAASVSAALPDWLDHANCKERTSSPIAAFRQTCRQAYIDTGEFTGSATTQPALHFKSLEQLHAFSVLLDDDHRENIRDVRIDITEAISDPADPH